MASRDSPTKYKLFLKMYWNEKMYKTSKDSSKPAEAPAKLSEVREACVDSNTRKSSGREHQSKMTDVSRIAFTCAAMLENKGHNRGKCISEKALHQCRMDNPSNTKLLINIENVARLICWHGICTPVYVDGRSIVFRHHKPLVSIFTKPVKSAPKCLERLRIRQSSAGDEEIRYERGKEIYATDTMSRTPYPYKDNIKDSGRRWRRKNI